jgi:hypothetical protein
MASPAAGNMSSDRRSPSAPREAPKVLVHYGCEGHTRYRTSDGVD